MFIHHLNIQPSSLKLSQFCGICFDSCGYLIATDYGNGVYVFKPSGEHVASSVLVSSDEIEHPSGVAVDEDGLCMCVVLGLTMLLFSVYSVNYLFTCFIADLMNFTPICMCVLHTIFNDSD